MVTPPLRSIGIRFAILLAVGCLPLASWVFAEADVSIETARDAMPNTHLPERVSAPEGELTLFADFGDRICRFLYLVNRTGHAVRMGAQDGALRIKLEYLRPDGVWERAQDHTDVDSFCGNSYRPLELPADHFLRAVGYSPTQGEKVRVRYAAYPGGSLHSNQGDGWVLAKDIEAARGDRMALNALPASIVRLLVPDVPFSPQSAMAYPPVRRVAALRLLQAYSDHPIVRKNAQELADQWSRAPKSDPDAVKAATTIHEILASRWTNQGSRAALLSRCVRALAGRTDGAMNDFGLPEDHPDLVWDVIADVASQEIEPDAKIWGPVVARIPEFAQKEPYSIARLLEASRVVDATLPDSFLEEVLQTPHPSVQRSCAGALSRRKQWKSLVEFGWGLKPEGQVVVLAALAAPPDPGSFFRSVREPADNEERRFWEHCMKTQTIRAAAELSSIETESTTNPFGRVVHDPLRDFLLHAANLSDQQARDFDMQSQGYQVGRVVRFLAAWGLEEDREVLKSLLIFRGYQREEGVRGQPPRAFVAYRYPVRAAARAALLQAAVPFTDDIVLERDMTAVDPPQSAATSKN